MLVTAICFCMKSLCADFLKLKFYELFLFGAGNKFLKSRFVFVKFDYPNPNLGVNRIFRLRILKIWFGFEIFIKMKVNREYSWIRKFPNGTSKRIYCDTNFVTCVTLLNLSRERICAFELSGVLFKIVLLFQSKLLLKFARIQGHL